MNREEFIEKLLEINIKLSEEQIKQFDMYLSVLKEYNEHTNLTALKCDSDIYLKHFYDSATMNKYIKNNQKVLDIGTGAGFPGIVLAILNPQSTFILLDSNNKKIKFLEYLNSFLKLDNVELINDRAENYVKNHLEEFDIATSRAVADLRILAELSIPALKIDGYFIPMKANINKELKDLENALDILNGKIETIEKFLLPIENSNRTIILIKHIAKTDKIFPRGYDKILKNPLKKNNK